MPRVIELKMVENIRMDGKDKLEKFSKKSQKKKSKKTWSLASP